MSKDLTIDGDSDYATGTQDTETQLSDGSSGDQIVAANINGLAKFAVALQGILGRGPDLKGTAASLVARLATIVGSAGGLVSGTAFPTVPPPQDGQPFYRTDLNLLYIFEGVSQSWMLPQPAANDHSTLIDLLNDDHPQYVRTDGTRIITGNQEIKKSVPTFRIRGTELSAKEFGFQENAGLLTVVKNTGSEGVPIFDPAQPIWWPIIGPTGTGPGSSAFLEPATTWSSAAPISGLHIFNGALVLNAGVTITIPQQVAGALVLISAVSITILGTISGIGAGCPGGQGGYGTPGGVDAPPRPASSGQPGVTGTGQPGGGGGGGDLMNGGPGGGVRGAAGGSRGQAAGTMGAQGGFGGNGVQVSGANLALGFATYVFYGGGGGGGGGGGASEDTNHGPGGDGGNGGADIVLIAPTVTLGLGAVLNTSGNPGIVNGGLVQDGNTLAGSGGGGGAGNVWIYANTFVNNGCTFTQNGGLGPAAPINGHGGNGAAGLKQIFLFNNPLQFR